MKDEFKAFVRTKPQLAKYVNSGEMTWQKFFEQWSIYGANSDVWNKYEKEDKVKIEESFNFANLVDSLKKVDMNAVQKGLDSVGKAIELFQGFGTKTPASTNKYEPRQLFKKFED
ncbi:MAG: spore coat protein YlbD [Bacilli bacterium]